MTPKSIKNKSASNLKRSFKLMSDLPPFYYFYLFIGLIVAFAFLFFVIQGFKGIDLTLRDSFYFSVITITTLGYGDIVPISYWTKFWAAFEAILGIIVFGLFLMALAEKRSETTAKDTLGWLTGGDSVPHLAASGAGLDFLCHFRGEYPLFDLTVGMQEYWVPLAGEDLPENYFHKMQMEYPMQNEMVPFKNLAQLNVPVLMKNREYHSPNTFSFSPKNMLFPETKKFMIRVSFSARNGHFKQIIAGRVANDGEGIELRSLLIDADGKIISGDDVNWKVVTKIFHPQGNTTQLHDYVYNWNEVKTPDWEK